MYGLFFYNYDHYEWEDLIAVSKSKEKLADRYTNEKASGCYPLITSEGEHEKMKGNEEFHYMIVKIEYI